MAVRKRNLQGVVATNWNSPINLEFCGSIGYINDYTVKFSGGITLFLNLSVFICEKRLHQGFHLLACRCTSLRKVSQRTSPCAGIPGN